MANHSFNGLEIKCNMIKKTIFTRLRNFSREHHEMNCAFFLRYTYQLSGKWISYYWGKELLTYD